MLLDQPGRFLELNALHALDELDTISGAALRADPGSSATLVVEAEAVPSTAAWDRARSMSVAQRRGGDTQVRQECRASGQQRGP